MLKKIKIQQFPGTFVLEHTPLGLRGRRLEGCTQTHRPLSLVLFSVSGGRGPQDIHRTQGNHSSKSLGNSCGHRSITCKHLEVKNNIPKIKKKKT